MNVTAEDVENVLRSIVDRADAELLAIPDGGLEVRWYFHWEEKSSIEWNTYKFSDALERFKRDCRRWEEQHYGSGCVVERVRDKYLMPKIQAFLAELLAHSSNSLK